MRAAKFNRKVHRVGAILAALPLLVIIASGIVLQLKKSVGWIQPPTQRGTPGPPALAFDGMLAAARSVPAAKVASWDDIERIDVQPARGLAKVQTKERIEIQVDLTTGAVLQSAIRRSDLIESLHDGTFFHERVRLWIFLPAAVILFLLHLSGLYLWFLPHLVRRRKRRLAQATGITPR